jgi:ABC-type transport system involved in multi-copper enzyme maturation permease subunit
MVHMLGPIFAREWLTLARRSRHYLLRSVYLGGLWILLVTLWQASVGWDRSATISDLGRFGLIAFQLLAFVQLALLLFFAALAAASAISQEKDRRTFVLLLMTDLTNYEIVLGKQLGSLLQIGVFLLGTAPILALLGLVGGIAPDQVVAAFLVLTTTALASGALGSLIALWRDKTFQATALTVLCLVLYLVVVQALSLLPAVIASIDADTVYRWQGWLHPFLAMQQVVDPPPYTGSIPVATGGSFGAWLVAALADGWAMAQGYALAMLAVAVLLNAWSMLKLRVWNPSGEPVMQRDAADADSPAEVGAHVHAAPGPVRNVWSNPIPWREIATRAYGRRPLLVKAAYGIVVLLVSYYALFVMPVRPWAAAYGLVPVAIISLLLISAQSVTSITSERDLGALDLLMVTDVTGREFIYGKLLGICWNTKEFILPPLILAVIYAVRGQLASAAPGNAALLMHKNFESVVCVLLALLVLMAFTMVLGLHVALRTYNSRLSVINTLGTVFFLSVGTLVCIYLILINGRFEYQWFSFIGFLSGGIGGLWWVLNGDRQWSAPALTLASVLCPLAVFYTVTNILIGKPGQFESSDPLIPFLVTGGAFGFTLAAMLIPLLSEFDVAVGRTSAIGE